MAGDISSSIKVIAFDVFGTVVDWRGSIAREIEAMQLPVDGATFHPPGGKATIRRCSA